VTSGAGALPASRVPRTALTAGAGALVVGLVLRADLGAWVFLGVHAALLVPVLGQAGTLLTRHGRADVLAADR
jgi:hypothetical protein